MESAPPADETTGGYDYTQPAPASETAELSYFSDALFIGDSRTEGLQLYSGISDVDGVSFFCYKGITVFDVMQDNPQKAHLSGRAKILHRGCPYQRERQIPQGLSLWA